MQFTGEEKLLLWIVKQAKSDLNNADFRKTAQSFLNSDVCKGVKEYFREKLIREAAKERPRGEQPREIFFPEYDRRPGQVINKKPSGLMEQLCLFFYNTIPKKVK